MTTKDVAKSVNKRVTKLFIRQNIRRMPMLYDRVATRPKILFLGLNPSFKKAAQKNPASAYYTKNAPRFNRRLIEEQRRQKADYRIYYGVLDEFCQSLGIDLWDPSKPASKSKQYWEHIDLLFERESKPAKVAGISGKSLTPFGWDQLQLSFELIKTVRPHNIIIVDSLAASLFAKYSPLPHKSCHLYSMLNFGRAKCRVFYSMHWRRLRERQRLSLQKCIRDNLL